MGDELYMDNFIDYINLDFEKAQAEYWVNSPEFYVYAWRFCKSILLINNSDVDEKEDNIKLINNNILDESLRNKVHDIRIRRNEYEHKNDNYTRPIKTTYIKDLKTLNEFIDYSNFKCNNGRFLNYRFENESIKKKETKKNITRGFEFETVEENNEKIDCTILFNDSKHIYYKCGYNSVPVEFRILSEQKTYVSNPIYAVIHNILIRSIKIKMSSSLRNARYNSKDLDRIFIYEILLLNSIKFGYLSGNIQQFIVPKGDKETFQLALNDVTYWATILSKMSGETQQYVYNSISEVDDMDITSVFIIVNSKKIEAEIIMDDNIRNTNSIWIDKKIDYYINQDNYRYYQLLLQEVFGLNDFKEGQYIAINKLLSADIRTLLVILPTGYGKSLIYQFLSLIQPCISIVISPSYELIYDQLTNLKETPIDLAGYLSIDDNVIKHYERYKRLKVNEICIKSIMYYFTPNDILNASTLNILSFFDHVGIINSITIDECHHMSIWGHKFEAEFFTITKQLIDRMSKSKTLLCSATASLKVKQDLRNQIGSNKLSILQPHSLDRGHINYKFIKKENLQEIIVDISKLFVNNYLSNNEFDCSIGNKTPNLTIIVNNDRSVLNKIYSELIRYEQLKDLTAIYSGEKATYIKFRAGRKTILMCSEEYLYGVNIKYLRNIVFIGYSPSKEWFYQQTGRVGRKGQESNVVNYLFDNSSDGVKIILDESTSEDELITKFLNNNIQYDDLSNVIFINDTIRNKDKEIETIINLFTQITEKVYVSSTYKYGRLRGKILKSEKEIYNFALYVMFLSGVIIKWVIDEETGDTIKYIFGVDMKFESDTFYFEEIAIELIRTLSGNEEIVERYLNEILRINGNVMGVLETLVKWYIINTVEIKRQMFINQFQLSEDCASSVLSNNEIEKDLDNYFIGAIDDKNLYKSCEIVEYHFKLYGNDALKKLLWSINKDKLWKLKRSVSYNIEEDSSETNKNNILETESGLSDSGVKLNMDKSIHKYKENIMDHNFSIHGSENVTKSDAILMNINNSETNKNNILETKSGLSDSDIKLNMDLRIHKKEENIIDHNISIHEFESVEKSDGDLMNIKNSDMNRFFIRTYGEHLDKKEILEEKILDDIIEYLLNADIDENYKIKAYIERKLEDRNNFNYVILLAIYELMTLKQERYYRVRSVVKKLQFDTLSVFLVRFNKYLKKRNKIIIDAILQENNHRKIFYYGFFGTIRRIFDK
jgi:hypothetical protein